jgi:hypothetical protein
MRLLDQNLSTFNGGMHEFSDDRQTYTKTNKKDYSNYKINFGKHKGRTFKDVKDNEKDYCIWLMKNTPSDFAKLFKDYIN